MHGTKDIKEVLEFGIFQFN